MPFRFVHTADIHLDSPLRSLALRNADLGQLVGDATRQALVSIVDLCLAEAVDALVIAGDLYDGDQTSMKTARFIATQLGRLHEADIAVFIVRGNHDALSKITQELILPDSVKIFGSRAETITLRRGALDISLHGLSFSRPHAPESLLPKFRAPSPDTAHIGIMHTSLAGAPGHDNYAPCSLADLQEWGFDYWALGHVHARAHHPGDRHVIMPGMPQGRDINEAGPKTVSLVTIADDRSVTVEERLTSIAQFERLAVDLSGQQSWREVIDALESSVAALRAATAAPHLVLRLKLAGETPLSWRMRRDRDLLLTEIEQRLEELGQTWIEKIELATTSPNTAEIRPSADPVLELGDLMRTQSIGQHSVRETLRQLVKDVRDSLPPEARRFAGDDEAGFEAFIDQVLSEGSEDVVARLRQSEAGAD
ncbi:DNA repair exonuclease [Devosia sp. 1635]|uniref:metallophosphoesterase family protein n=1 Tax=Devosia sp. 1635 TaxID=2726066 RepID=UPI0015638AB9|nr:DNA repair exonuclease [Devosia sp. 1635]